MEEVTKNIANLSEDVKSFAKENNAKMENLEKEITELKKENLDNARKISEISVKNVNPTDGSASIQSKYFSDMDEVLRGYAQGRTEIKGEFLENARNLARIYARKSNLGSEQREEKFVSDCFLDVKGSAFPVLEVKAQNTYSNVDGGVLIAPAKRDKVYVPEGNDISLLNLVRRIPTTANMLEVPEETANSEGFFEGENGSTETGYNNYGLISIGTGIAKGVRELTRTMVEDYNGNIYSYLYPRLVSSLNEAIERAIIVGDGNNGRPKGIATYGESADDKYEVGKIKTVSANDVEGLSDAIRRQVILCKAKRKSIVMNRTTFADLMDLKDNSKKPLLQPQIATEGPIYSLYGYNVYLSDYCPTFQASGSKAVFIGDFEKAYTVVERTGAVVEFAPSQNNNEKIRYILRQRIGGGMVGFDSVVAIKKA